MSVPLLARLVNDIPSIKCVKLESLPTPPRIVQVFKMHFGCTPPSPRQQPQPNRCPSFVPRCIVAGKVPPLRWSCPPRAQLASHRQQLHS